MTQPDIRFPTHAFINGRAAKVASGDTFDTLNPSNGQVLAKIAKGGAADVDAAVASARAAFDTGPWPRLSPAERKDILIRFAGLIDVHKDELALLEALEAGKPITDCTEIDVPETAASIRWHAEAADKLYDHVAPTSRGIRAIVQREPVGVVGVILPWNFPLLMAAWKLGPILATGNTCVLKPAEQTSMSTIRLAELATEAGIPDGVINVVPGLGPDVGAPIGLHNDVDCVGFTGSTATGRLFLEYAAKSNLKRVLLECGGKNPMVVMPDFDDLERVAEHACSAIFWNMGENCSSNSRLLVHKTLEEPLTELILEKTRDWVVGDATDPKTRIGPMVEQAHLDKVLSHIEAARKSDAKLLRGGNRVLTETGGYFVAPTIFGGVAAGDDLYVQEVFGPVLAITSFDKPEDGIRLANDTEYGLAASVFTNDTRTAHNASNAIRAGTVTVNCFGEGDNTTPFGGYGLSGFGGRDKSIWAHDQYCEQKTIWMDLS